MNDAADVIGEIRLLSLWTARRREAINASRRNVVLRVVFDGKRSITRCRCCTDPQCPISVRFCSTQMSSLSRSFT